MLKRLPIFCATMLALAACSHDGHSGAAAASAPSVATAVAAATTAGVTPTAPVVTAPAPETPVTSTPSAAFFVDNGKWVEGTDDSVIDAGSKLTETDKIKVAEAFSYGCPACNADHPTMQELVRALPSKVIVAHLPASFMPQENSVTLQRAYYAAQSLGVAEKANDAMYDAVCSTHELSAENASGTASKPSDTLPTLEDIAKVYAKFGASPKDFVALANSFTVNLKMKRADDMMKTCGVEGTPALISNGRYRVDPLKLGDMKRSIELTRWLVAKEAAGAQVFSMIDHSDWSDTLIPQRLAPSHKEKPDA